MSTEGIDAQIRAGDGSTRPELTDEVLAEIFDSAAPSVELHRDDTDYLTARLLPDGAYQLDHCAGSATELFQLFTPDRTLVRDMLRSWLAGESWWRAGVAWFPIDPEITRLRTAHDEMAVLLDGMSVLGGLDDLESSFGELESSMDDALARADALLAAAPEGPESPGASGDAESGPNPKD